MGREVMGRSTEVFLCAASEGSLAVRVLGVLRGVAPVFEVVYGHVEEEGWGLPAACLQDGAEAFSANHQISGAALPTGVGAEAAVLLCGRRCSR